MVHFFRILSPDCGKRTEARDALGKTEFFGGVPDFSFGAVPLSPSRMPATSPARGPSPRKTGPHPPGLLAPFALPDPAAPVLCPTGH